MGGTMLYLLGSLMQPLEKLGYGEQIVRDELEPSMMERQHSVIAFKLLGKAFPLYSKHYTGN